MKSEAPRGKPRGNLLRRSSIGYTGRVFAEPCDLSADLSGVALAKTEAIRAKGEAKNTILSSITASATEDHPCGSLLRRSSSGYEGREPQGFPWPTRVGSGRLAKKGKVLMIITIVTGMLLGASMFSDCPAQEQKDTIDKLSILEKEPAKYSGGITRDYCEFLAGFPNATTISLPLSPFGLNWGHVYHYTTGSGLMGVLRTFSDYSLLPAALEIKEQTLQGNKFIAPLGEFIWRPNVVTLSGKTGKPGLEFKSKCVFADKFSVLCELSIANTGKEDVHPEILISGQFMERGGTPISGERYDIHIDPKENMVELIGAEANWTSAGKPYPVYAVLKLSGAEIDSCSAQVGPLADLKEYLKTNAKLANVTAAKAANNLKPVSYGLLIKPDIYHAKTKKIKLALGLSLNNIAEAKRRCEETLKLNLEEVSAKNKQMWNTLLSNGPQPAGDDDLAKAYYLSCQTLYQATVPAGAPLYSADSVVVDGKINYIGHWQWDPMMALLGFRYIYPGYIDSILQAYFDLCKTAGQAASTSWHLLKVYEATGDKQFADKWYLKAKDQLEQTMRAQDEDKDKLKRASSGLIGESDQITLRLTPNARAVEGVGDAAIVRRDYLSLAELARITGREEDIDLCQKEAAAIKENANKILWDEKAGIYRVVEAKSNAPINILTADAFVSFFGDIPDKEKQAALLRHLTNPDEFWTEVPVPSIAINDPEFKNRWWDGGVWTYLNYFIIKGLRMGAHEETANELLERTVRIIGKRGPEEAWGPKGDWGRTAQYVVTAAHMIDLFLERCGIFTEDGKLTIRVLRAGWPRDVFNFRFHGTRFDIEFTGKGDKIGSVKVDGKDIRSATVPDKYYDGKTHKIMAVLE